MVRLRLIKNNKIRYWNTFRESSFYEIVFSKLHLSLRYMDTAIKKFVFLKLNSHKSLRFSDNLRKSYVSNKNIRAE